LQLGEGRQASPPSRQPSVASTPVIDRGEGKVGVTPPGRLSVRALVRVCDDDQ